MPIVDIADLKAALTPGRGLLGLDVGAKTLGLAVCDPLLTVASPIGTLKRGKFAALAEAVMAVAREREIGGFVVGLPIGMDGREGPACQSVRQFAANLLAAADLPLAFWDERLSTRAVERMLVEQADMTRKRRAKVVDSLAAAWILQGALDAIAAQARRASDEPNA